MNWPTALVLMPMVALVLALLGVLLIGAFFPSHGRIAVIAYFGIVTALALVATVEAPHQYLLDPLIVFDSRTRFFSAMILLAGLAVALMSSAYWQTREVHGETHHREYYALLLVALAGALLLVASRHYAALFLGLEIMSVALFGLIAYPVREVHALEAATKYLVLSGSSSALLLLGMAFAYAATGSLEFSARASMDKVELYRAGLLLMTVAFAFKLSLVPFHMWTPDVYEGSPAPVGALLATVSKSAAAVAWWRLLVESGATHDQAISGVLVVLAMLSMLAGNLLGLFQENVKRMLAYSSVGHMGFWLVPLVVAGPITEEAAGYYLVTYVAAVLAAFGVIAYLSVAEHERDVVEIASFRGLFWRRPGAALALGAALLSLAGIPLTVGFIAKFYLFAAAIDAANWAVVITVALSSAIGIYFYLRLVTVLFLPGVVPHATVAVRGNAVLLLLMTFIVLFGVMPAPFMDAVREAVVSP
jgi:NADH-quinone oxidoreductase subunit N